MVHAVRAQQRACRRRIEVALHPGDAFLLERFVADREHLVGDEQVGRERRRDREAETHDHPRRVVLDRIVDVLADIGERDDLVALRRDLDGRKPEQRGREIDVRASPCIPDESRSRARAVRRRGRSPPSLPRVGLITPATILSSVDFPAPFSPISPSDSPRRSSKRDAIERAEHVRGGAAAQQVCNEPQSTSACVDFRVVLADVIQSKERCRRGIHAAPALARAALIRNPRNSAIASGRSSARRRTTPRRRPARRHRPTRA